MDKIEKLNYGGPSDETTTIVATINEVIDAVKNLQEHRDAQRKENQFVYAKIESVKSKLVDFDHVADTGKKVSTVDNQAEKEYLSSSNAEELRRENGAYNAGIEFAVKKLHEISDKELSRDSTIAKRVIEMKSIYTTNQQD